MKPKYYFFYVEMALRDPNDLRIYGFKNISHVPTKKLVEIFNINLKKDPNIIEGYFLTKSRYRKFKKYIDKNFGTINLDLFEYSLSQYGGYDEKSIRRAYKLNLME